MKRTIFKHSIVIIKYSILIVLSITYRLAGQTGTINSVSSPDREWAIISAEQFDLIFPAEIDSKAKLLAGKLNYIINRQNSDFSKPTGKIAIILQNRTMYSNAWVQLGPRKTQWNLVPPQSTIIGNLDWLDLIAIHEYRHVIQYDNTRQGLIKLISGITGEFGWDIISMLSVPLWYWEGDAVGQETNLTFGGRGRLPEFHTEFRAALNSFGIQSYEYAYLNSYNYYFPDHYRLGYILHSYISEVYGHEVWKQVLAHTSRWAVRPYPFSAGLKKATGKTLDELYFEALIGYYSDWQKDIQSLEITAAKTINIRRKQTWTSYSYPQYISDNDILAIKYGIGDIPQFIVINCNTGNEEQLFMPGWITENHFSCSQNKIVWCEEEPDQRWWGESTNKLMVYNIASEMLQTIRHTRYQSPVLSNNGEVIAVVEVNPDGSSNLVLVNANTGLKNNSYSFTSDAQLSSPTWKKGDNQLLVIVAQNGIRSLVEIDNLSGYKRVLFETSEVISQPTISGNYVFYNSNYSGIDNIYAFDIINEKHYQITSRKFRAVNGCVNNQGTQLIFSDYSGNGYDIAGMKLDSSNWIPKDSLSAIHTYPAISDSTWISQFESPPEIEYNKSDYTHKLINIHSWFPYFEFGTENIGFKWISNDLMGYLNSTFAIFHNTMENTFNSELALNYQKLYPVIGLMIRTGGRRAGLYSSDDELSEFRWNEKSLGLNVGIPGLLTINSFTMQYYLGSGFNYNQISNSSNIGQIENGHFLSSTLQGNANISQRKSALDIISPRAVETNFAYRYVPGDNDSEASRQLFGNLLFNIPGFNKYHAWQLRFEHEQQSGEYHFLSEALNPRGYFSLPTFNDFTSFALNYHFPFGYPDIKLGRLLFINRLKMNIFNDYATTGSRTSKTYYHSVGLEILVESHIMRFIAPVDWGIRIAFPTTEKQINFMILLFGSDR